MEEGIQNNTCHICMDVLTEPKTLLCRHTFCKECMERLLKFRYDGSALITCPMKCKEETLIPCDETTDCLTTNLESFIHLDLSKTLDDAKARCQWKTCVRKICTFCSLCNLKFCDKCWTEHLNSCFCDSPTTVKYDSKRKHVSVICKQHHTKVDFMCLNCRYEFICVYCKHRNHKGHFVENIQKSLIRLESVINNERKYIQVSKTAVNEIDNCEQKLIAELKKRKLKCLVEYVSMLNEEEMKILLKYREGSCIFKNIVHNGSSTPDDALDATLKYFDKELNMDDLPMLIARRQTLFSLGRSSSMPSIEVNLSSSISTPDKLLGNVCMEINEMSLSIEEVNDPVHFEFQETEINLEDSDFLRGFQDYLTLGKELTSKERDSKLNPDAIPVFFPTRDICTNAKVKKEIHSQLNPEAIPVFYPSNDVSLQQNFNKEVRLNPSVENFNIL